MPKFLAGLLKTASKQWARFNEFLYAENDRRVMAWGSALQYKRSYTNPDTAKRYRARLPSGSRLGR